MKLQIITPEKILFSENVEMVNAPGVEGEFGVLDGHAPFISTLQSGEIVVTLQTGREERFSIQGGVADVTPEQCTLLVETLAA